MKDLVITWPTVGLVTVLCAFFAVLVKYAPPSVFAAGGIVSIAVAAALRQAAYKKPTEGDSSGPPAFDVPPVTIPQNPPPAVPKQ